jgi:predicted nucleic acid-binding protein
MAGVFVDTWGWLALRDKGDARHLPATTAVNGALKAGRVVTTDFVLDETFTLLFRRLPALRAAESIEFLMAAIEAGAVALEPISPARFGEAVKLRLRYKDKPEISFTVPRCL